LVLRTIDRRASLLAAMPSQAFSRRVPLSPMKSHGYFLFRRVLYPIRPTSSQLLPHGHTPTAFPLFSFAPPRLVLVYSHRGCSPISCSPSSIIYLNATFPPGVFSFPSPSLSFHVFPPRWPFSAPRFFLEVFSFFLPFSV